MQRRSYLLATLLHGLILILVIFGLPQLISPLLEVKPIIEVEVLTISSHPNAAPNNPIPSPVKEPKPDPAPPPETKPPPPPEPPLPPPPPEPKLPPPPKPTPTPPPPEPPKPEPVKPPPKPPEPKPEPVKPPPKPPEPKPEPVKPPPKPPEPKKEDFFDMMAKTLPLPKESPKTALKTETKPAEKPTDFFDMMAKTLPTKPPSSPPSSQAPVPAARSLGPADADRPLSRSEEDGIRRTIAPCWNFDPGMANVRDIQIEVRLFLGPDSSVKNVELVDRSIVNRSPQYQAAALAAMRAPMNPACNKLPIPPGAYKSLVIVFAPKDFM